MPDFSKQRSKTSELAKKVGSHATKIQVSSSQHVTKHVLKKAKKFSDVRRFVVGWLLVVGLLCAATISTLIYVNRAATINAPSDGGTYTEGLIGTVNNLNPLFATGGVDDSATKLMFNGLLKYNSRGELIPDLAKEWKVDDSRKVYTIVIRDDVYWHDGRPLTAEDVEFTVSAIQNPASRSPLFASWQGIKVKAVNKTEVTFELPAPFAPFPGALTLPIVPKHALADTPADKLRTSGFSANPIGTGPFVFGALRNDDPKQHQVELVKNEKYFHGAPKLKRFILHSYPDDESLARALREREITAAVDLKIDTVESFANDKSIRTTDIPLNSGVFAFMKNSAPLFSEAKIRGALVSAIDRQAMLKLFNTRYTPLRGPLLPYQLGYDSGLQQQTNKEQAEKTLDEAGWVKQADGIRAKDGVRFEFSITTVNSAQYTELLAELQKQWQAIGISVKSQLLTSEQLQQTALSAHAYDVLLYGISIGRDPDVYAYWHSSQARTGGLNFSEWKSGRADASLEVARTRLESVLREARYKTFQDEWLNSAPAVALYQPRVSYSYHQNSSGVSAMPANNAADRLSNVEEWTVSTKRVKSTP